MSYIQWAATGGPKRRTQGDHLAKDGAVSDGCPEIKLGFYQSNFGWAVFIDIEILCIKMTENGVFLF